MRLSLRSAACGLTAGLFVALTACFVHPAPKLLAEETAPPMSDRMSRASLVYKDQCASCHGSDGAARRARRSSPEIPDFTKPEWHAGKTDARLTVAILEGKGDSMPAYHGKIDKRQAEDLVAYVRAFNPKAKDAGGAGKAADKPKSGDDFDKQYRALQDELKVLKKQFDEAPPERKK
jgi:mono/diheme cytochrome c family protein